MRTSAVRHVVQAVPVRGDRRSGQAGAIGSAAEPLRVVLHVVLQEAKLQLGQFRRGRPEARKDVCVAVDNHACLPLSKSPLSMCRLLYADVTGS